MEPNRAYLDHNASSPLRPEAAEAVLHALRLAGNPSSVHAEGRAARSLVEAAREEVARLVGAAARSVIFTSGGTEACAMALSPARPKAGVGGMMRLLVGAAEHVAVLDGHGFAPGAVERIPVGPDGIVDLAALERMMAAGPALVSIQAANNETGVIQPVAQAGAIVHAAGGLLHCDAVQAAGRMPLDMAALEVDALSLSAHKLGGPKGVGALVLASERGGDLAGRLIRGGGQERGWRAGTENVAGIAGFGAAAACARRDLAAEGCRLAALRDGAERALRRVAPEAAVFGERAPRLPNTLAFAVPGMRAETALIAFDLAGVALSSGSACSSGKVRCSHVLEAMGVAPPLTEGALRVSFGWNSTEDDALRFVRTCETVLATLYQRRADAA